MASLFNCLNYNTHVPPIVTQLPFDRDGNVNTAQQATACIKRVVLVNSVNAIGALHAAALATSRLLHPSHEIILTNFLTSAATTTTSVGKEASNSNKNNNAKTIGEVKKVEVVLSEIRAIMKKHRHTNNDINKTNYDIQEDTFLSYQYYYGGENVFPLSEEAVDGLLDRIKIVPDASDLYGSRLPQQQHHQQQTSCSFENDLFLFVLNADVLPSVDEQGGTAEGNAYNAKEALRGVITAHVGSFFDFFGKPKKNVDRKGNVIVMADHRSREILLEENLFFLDEKTDEVVKTEEGPKAAAAEQKPASSSSSTRVLDDLKKDPAPAHSQNGTPSGRLQWNIAYTWVRALSPPALDYSLTHYSVFNFANNQNVLTTTSPATPTSSPDKDNSWLYYKNYFNHSLLPLVCMHTMMGTLQHLPSTTHRLTPVPVVPVDVALNTALLQFAHLCDHNAKKEQQQRAKKKAATPAEKKEDEVKNIAAASVVSIAMPEVSLVWGMVIEYLVDYYGRYAKDIKAAVDQFYADENNKDNNKNGNWSALFSVNPNLLTFINVNDFKAFKMGNNMLVPQLERAREIQRRKKVASFVEQLQSGSNNNNNSSSSANMKPLLQYSFRLVDRSIHQAQRLSALPNALRVPKAASRKQRAAAAALAAIPSTPYNTSPRAFHTATYRYLLEKLALQPRTSPLLQLVSLHDIDFDMYVRTVALAVLDQIAAIFTSATAANIKRSTNGIVFPRPTRLPQQNFIYDPSVALPQHPIFSRRALGAFDWFLRQGMQPNGRPLPVQPGMTPARLAALLGQPEVQRIAHNIAAAEGVAVTAVEQRARRMLLRIGDTLDHHKCCSVGLLVRYLFRNVYDRVQTNREAHMRMYRLFQLPRTHIVLVPHHRSYVDFIVMTYILVISCLPHPHIVSGEDFLKMGKFSEIMRASGAFFMRRSFRGDALYSLCFREYVKQLVRHQQTMEFFLEGTRSRTGKTMTPKIGILKFITDAFFEKGQNDVDDVLFVPVSVSYDALLEGRMYARELLGVPKPPESVPNMIKAGLALRQSPHGSVNVFFGDPISLRGLQEKQAKQHSVFSCYCPAPYTPKEAPPANAACFTAAPPPTATPGGSGGTVQVKKSPEELQRDKDRLLLYKTSSSTPAWMLTGLGWTLTYHLQKNIMITPPALVAALVEAFEPFYVFPAKSGGGGVGAGGCEGVPLRDLFGYFGWLKDKINSRDGKLRSDIQNHSSEEMVRLSLARLHRFIYVNEKEEVVFRRAAPPPAAGGGGEQSGGGGSDDEREEALMARIGVNISTNQLIHVFIDEAIVAVVAHGYSTSAASAGTTGASKSANASSHYQTHHITVINNNEKNSGSTQRSVARRQVRQDVLNNMAMMLHQLCSTEFPNYSKYSPCSFASWMSVTLERMQRSENSLTSPSNNNNNNKATNNGPLVSIPLTPLYYFTQQLLFPHIETMYVVVLSVEGLFAPLLQPPAPTPTSAVAAANTKAEVVISVRDAVLATCKTYRAVYQDVHFPKASSPSTNNTNNNNNNEKVNSTTVCIDYTVSASKEVVQHYFDALVEMSFLKRTAGPKGPSFALCAAAAAASLSTTSNSHNEAAAAAPLLLLSAGEEGNGLASLRRLSAQLAPMRARTPEDLMFEKKYIQKIVLEKYAKLMEGAKI